MKKFLLSALMAAAVTFVSFDAEAGRGGRGPSTSSYELVMNECANSFVTGGELACYEPERDGLPSSLGNDKNFIPAYLESNELFGSDEWSLISYAEGCSTDWSEHEVNGSVGLFTDFTGFGTRTGTFGFAADALDAFGDIMVSLKFGNYFQAYLMSDLIEGATVNGDGDYEFDFNIVKWAGGIKNGALSHLSFWATESEGGLGGGGDVSAVPVPGALPLFASALVAGGVMMRKRKKAQK